MDARHGIPRARTLLVLVACAFALPAGYARADTAADLPPEPSALVIEQEPQATPAPSAPVAAPPESVVAPQDPAPAVITDAGGPQLGVEAPAPQPAREPQAEPDPAPAPGPDSPPGPAADVPNPSPAPLEAPEPEARVAPISTPPARDNAIADSGPRLLAEVDARLRRVERSMERVKSQAGKAPAHSALRELAKNFERLAPAVVALARYRASHPSHELDTGGVERRLRRAIAGAAALVAELAHSSADSRESDLLVTVLERFAGVPAIVGRPGRTGTGEAPSGAVGAVGAVGAQPAYTYTAAASAQSWSGIASDAPYPAATVGSPRRVAFQTPYLPGLLRLGVAAASTNFSMGLAALALLIALAVSASLSAFLLSGWGLETSRTSPAGRPPGSVGGPSPRRRTSTSA